MNANTAIAMVIVATVLGVYTCCGVPRIAAAVNTALLFAIPRKCHTRFMNRFNIRTYAEWWQWCSFAFHYREVTEVLQQDTSNTPGAMTNSQRRSRVQHRRKWTV
jgi:hypothetical protein